MAGAVDAVGDGGVGSAVGFAWGEEGVDWELESC